ncbi:MAG: peptide deformylase [Candidatus Omnitrophota bacterium]
MAVKSILSYPLFQDILKAESVAVQMEDPSLLGIIKDLKDTLMATPNGVGLAAPQIGVLKRIFVLKKDYIINDLDINSALRRSAQEIITFINPKIVVKKGIVHEEEGCLSVPDAYIEIERAKIIKVRALNEQGEQVYEKLKGLASRAVQQEIDHLNGILIIDHK